MTHLAIGRDVQEWVFRIEARVVICLVTGYAGCWNVVIVSMVASITVIRNVQVGTCQRKKVTVV